MGLNIYILIIMYWLLFYKNEILNFITLLDDDNFVWNCLDEIAKIS